MLFAARGILTVETDNRVDWEVDQETVAPEHPHRERLRATWRAQDRRRAGALPAVAQICLSPVPQRTGHRTAPATMRAFARPQPAEARRTADCS